MNTNFYVNEVMKIIEQDVIFIETGKANNKWLSVLSIKINDLILNDFDKLIFLLYRLDINESKVIQQLKDYPGSNAGSIIADLIIERQLQKIKSRETFRPSDPGIDENEKW